MDKRRDLINLSVDMTQTTLSSSLKTWIPQNFTELINKPKKSFFKLSSASFRSNETFSSEVDFDKFDDIDLMHTGDSPRSTKSAQSLKEMMKQNYSDYIGSIKAIYPGFKFNHYSKYSEKVKRVTHSRASELRGSELSSATTKSSSLVDYQPSTKLASIGLGDEYSLPKEEFLISSELLERGKVELYDTEKLFDCKVEVIEIELERVLKNSSLIYNYIEENISLGAEIDRSIKAINGRRDCKKDLNGKYLLNSAKLMLKGVKRQNMIWVAQQMRRLFNLSQAMNTLLFLSKKESECNEMSEALSQAKTQLKEIKSIEKMKKVKFVVLYEKELMTFGNKSEQKLIEDFTSAFKRLFLISIGSSSATVPPSTSAQVNNQSSSSPKKRPMYNLSSPQLNEGMSDYFHQDSINLKLIAKTEECKAVLYQLLDVLNIIRKDGMDMAPFVYLMEKSINETLMTLFKDIQALYSSQTFTVIEVMANCFKVVYANYAYIVHLLNVNYALISKDFSEANKSILNEMTKLLQCLISSALHEAMLSDDLTAFTSVKEGISNASKPFFDLAEIDVHEQFKAFNEEFILKFFVSQSSGLTEAFNKEEWVQLPKADFRYQEIANRLLSPQSTQDKDKANEHVGNSPEQEYLLLKESKYRLVSLSLTEISFLSNCLSLIESFKPAYHHDILVKASSLIEDISIRSKDLIMEGKGNLTERKFTEKETALLCANINLMRQLFQSTFSSVTNDKAMSEVNRLTSVLIDITSTCKEAMTQLLTELINLLISDLNSLDFANYPFYAGKEYNAYIKKFIRMIKLYETLLYAFDNSDITLIFNEQLKSCFEQMVKVVSSKCKIEADNPLKQFRKEMIYMKKVLKKFELISTEGLIAKVEEMSRGVNPNKVAKKVKAKKADDNH